MNFLKEIFHGNSAQGYIHQKFVRYGKGEFEGPAVIVKKTGNSIKVTATSDYSNILGWILAKNSNLDLNVSGSIISKNLTESVLGNYGITPAKTKKKSGVFTFDVKGVFGPDNVRKLYEDLKDSVILFDISSDKGKIKTKKKLPKPGSAIDKQFCSATLDLSALGEVNDQILFDTNPKEFREIEIYHKYEIKELEIPEDDKKDPASARLNAKRRGSIKRVYNINGRITEDEHELLV